MPAARPCHRAQVTPLLVIDGYALFYIGLILAAACAVVVLLAYGYLSSGRGATTRSSTSCCWSPRSARWCWWPAPFRVASSWAWRLLSVALYALIAYHAANRARPLEAGIKYLVLAAASSAFLLFGMALVYAALGTLALPRSLAPLAAAAPRTACWLAGLALILVGVGFKLAVVPFHLWTPDVYQGAPAPVTAFIATVSKGAMFALLLRYFLQIRRPRQPTPVSCCWR